MGNLLKGMARGCGTGKPLRGGVATNIPTLGGSLGQREFAWKSWSWSLGQVNERGLGVAEGVKRLKKIQEKVLNR